MRCLTLGFSCLLGMIGTLGSAFAMTAEAARIRLVTLAETGSQGSSVEEVRKLVQSYRIDSTNAFMPLRLAPYPRFLLNAQMKEIYPALYQSSMNDFLNEIPLEVLFDGVLDMIISKKVPAEMKKDLSALDTRMAKRAKKGKSSDCLLDGSEAIEKVSKIKLFALKIDLVNAFSSCTYRTRLFNAAKADLIKARKKPEIKAIVKAAAKEQFPIEFRAGFLAKINGVIDTFPELVSQKFGGGKILHPIWSELGSIIEADLDSPVQGGRRTIKLKNFSQGLLADLFAAHTLMSSPLPRDRSLAAGLFYSVVNRWLLMTGGTAADWDDVKNEMRLAKTGVGVEPPVFRPRAFGGWGAEMDGLGIMMSPWDWGGYNPSDDEAPTPIRLFPTTFEIDSDGVGSILTPTDAYQTNEDLAYLLLAVSEFLKYTQPGMPLAQFFGGADQIADLLDPAKPMLFPLEGRMIAVGVLSAVAKNLLDPTIGHVASKRDGIPIYFRDQGRFGDLQVKDVDTRGVCTVLVAASKLSRVLKVDPLLTQVPELKSILPEIGSLVQISALVVGKEAQNFDGSVRSKMGSTDLTGNLGTQVAAIRVYLAAFNASETPSRSTFVMARLVPALSHLFSKYVSGTEPLSLDGRLNLLAVWNQSQAMLRNARPDLPWAQWEEQIRSISEK